MAKKQPPDRAQPPSPAPWARIAALLAVSGVVIAWDRWPLTHGSGVAHHDDTTVGFLVAMAGLAAGAWGLVLGYQRVASRLEATRSGGALFALRLATALALVVGYFLSATSGSRLGG